jgi:hypothetical protein
MSSAPKVQYRIRFLPNNSDGEKGIWYTGTAYGYEYATMTEAQEAAASYRDTGHQVRIEERRVTEWKEAS